MRKFMNMFDEEFAKDVINKSKGIHYKEYNFGSGINLKKILLHPNNSLGRPQGEYVTINIIEDDAKTRSRLIKILSKTVRKYFYGVKNMLIVGMGNENIISDSLGPACIQNLTYNYHDGEVAIAKFCPSVKSNSGINSFDLVASVVNLIKPDIVVVIDSLCTKEESRVGTSFQVTDTGIVPGSALGQNTCVLNKDSLGVRVVAIGVPMVVDLFSIVVSECKKIAPLSEINLKVLEDKFLGEIYSPKDVDYFVLNASKIISNALIKAVNFT